MAELGTVLLADPDPHQQQLISDALQQRYRVILSRSLSETIQLLMTYHPHVLLLEVNQPDGDGITLIKQLRQDPKVRDMVIACVTGRSSVRDKVAGFQAGADDYIIKPINIETFMWRLVLLMRLRKIS
jgi:two-component system, OmpR family, alkaline phosphatase synthesis response regulator PhoP